jgi:hypothetical protein
MLLPLAVNLLKPPSITLFGAVVVVFSMSDLYRLSAGI